MENFIPLPLPTVPGSTNKITEPGLYSVLCNGQYTPDYYNPAPPDNPLVSPEMVLLEVSKKEDGALIINRNRCHSFSLDKHGKGICNPLALQDWRVGRRLCHLSPETTTDHNKAL